MRVALLISGYTRSFELNLPSIKENILSKFSNVDVFLHITKEEDQDKYLNIIKSETIDNIKKNLNPKIVIEEDNLFITSDNKENNTINSWLKYYKLNKIKKSYEDIFGLYDLVIKYRPDLNIETDINFEDIKGDKLYIPLDSKIDISKLENNNDNYICDIFAYGDSASMDKYFNIYDELKSLINKYGPISETILYNYLKDFEIDYDLVNIKYNMILSQCNIFAICGDSGSGKTTLGNLLKKHFSSSFMLECDRYHKWERGDENWEKVTHLNPNANYLVKMNNDIFDLKVGKTIYQVDYDHKTGKFTEKERIDSNDNIIVCGLHSLYYKNDSIYDIKIFMDTNRDLKKYWKIKRDTKERGYNMDKILNQINSRQEDFEKYIYPQRDKSDIILNFTTDDEIDINNLDRDINVYLNILIRKKLNIKKIINNFYKNNINIKIEEDDKYNKLTFKEYKNCELFNQTNLNNFYDYIIYIILNIRK